MDFAKQSGKTFVNAILSGIFIGIAGTVYLAVPNAVVGAFLFAFGLMTILCYSFKLYTGAIGYLVNQGKNTPQYLWTLLLIWGGNLLGTYIVGSLIRASRTFTMNVGGVRFCDKIAKICEVKLNDSFPSLLFLSFFCGILMYVAVETYRREELAPIFRFATVFLCVAIFILSGYEHVIADMYYFSVAGVWSWNTLVCVLILTLGNSLGGWLIPLADKVRK